MRHWNFYCNVHQFLLWTIFTLPMRHWNPVPYKFSINDILAFLPYLWGIETKASCHCLYRLGLFLPYLWGIETLSTMIKVKNGWVNFYPTYEALKQCVNATTGNADWDDFYPTYEALKRSSSFYINNQFFQFLPYLWGIETLFWLQHPVVF